MTCSLMDTYHMGIEASVVEMGFSQLSIIIACALQPHIAKQIVNMIPKLHGTMTDMLPKILDCELTLLSHHYHEILSLAMHVFHGDVSFPSIDRRLCMAVWI